MKNKIIILGMTCNHCAQGVKKFLEQNGLTDVSINFSTGITYFNNPNRISIKNIKSSLKTIGYDLKLEKKNKLIFDVEKKFLVSLFFTIPLFMHMFLEKSHFLNNAIVQFALCIPVYFIGLSYFGKSAWNSLKMKIPNMDVLITLGSSAAFIYSLLGVYLYYGAEEMHSYLFFETTSTIITLVLLGNVMELRSVKGTTSAIEELLKLQPRKAVVSLNNQLKEVNISEIKVGDILYVNQGDKIPVDGIVKEGVCFVNESMITGESLPVVKKIEDKVIGGTILVEGNCRIEVKKVGNQTMLSSIVEMIQKAQHNKPEIQRFGDVVGSYFVPVVIAISLIAFFINYFLGISLQESLLRSIAVLVIACPCAMGLATPTAVMVGIGRASKNGILIRGGNVLEVLSKAKNFLFDKTGTLTTGLFNVEIDYLIQDKKRLNNLIYSLESYSSHPIAKSINSYLLEKAEKITLKNVREEKGVGVKAIDIDGNKLAIGSENIFKSNISKKYDVYLLENDKLIAGILLNDSIKDESFTLIKSLKDKDINLSVLSGDKKEKCEFVSRKLNIKSYYYQLFPSQKLNKIKQYKKEGLTVMVGDGINDSPSLASSDIGISLGNATQIAIQNADVVIVDGQKMSNVFTAYQISKHTLLTIKQNLFWAFSYNIVAIPIAAMGFLNPMWGAFFMAFSDIVVIGNSLRLKYKKIQ